MACFPLMHNPSLRAFPSSSYTDIISHRRVVSERLCCAFFYRSIYSLASAFGCGIRVIFENGLDWVIRICE